MGALGAPARQRRSAPTGKQRRAADPECSVWVTASAGTGKTRVLADRVLRLLLAGTEPLRVLCLTFTKAAAAEMTTRIQNDLVRFAPWPEPDLVGELGRLLGRAPQMSEIRRARTLLPRVLDLPAGLPVMTIHGFCQSLLRRFPIEAGVPPHFEVVEPREANDLLRQAQDEVLANAGGELALALRRVAVVLGEANLRDGLGALCEDRLRLSELLDDVEATIERVREALGVPPGMTLEGWTERLCRDPAIDLAGLRDGCRALGRNGDGLRAAVVADWLAAGIDERIATLEDYCGAFCTKDGKPSKRLIGQQAANAVPGALDAFQREQQRLVDALEQRKPIAVLERTAAVLRVGAAVTGRYAERKAREAVLDFDDLIACSRRLLARPGVSSWVNYKLDQQIDHLLVDEGQDTSPEQWAIIEALCDEFFAGAGARERRRTLFVVGDEKQSIFSFQGADLETFQKLHSNFAGRAQAAGAGWREEPLNRSFRCARPILEVVDAVFAGEIARDGVVTAPPLRHETARGEAPGSVEVWPLIEIQPQAKAPSWDLPDRAEAVDRPEQRLAHLIKRRIVEWRRSDVPLASTGKPLSAGDVMILLPRRGILQELLIRELKQNNVDVAGADRLALIDEIAVMDLMALGHAVLLPEDDFTLAAALRSPLFGLSEDELFELCYDRGPATLYERLRTRQHHRPSFREAWRHLTEARRYADFLPPFEFYCRLLGEGGGRLRFLARLGQPALEPVEAFLAQALAYERGHPPSLQGFLHWLGADSTELVRDPDQPRDEVRVLTVHGAKGLEGPVVFVADATFVPSQRDRVLWLEPDGLPVWRVSKDLRDPVSERADRSARLRDLQEQRRLLYVAMTRARDHLIVTGWKRTRPGEPTWYEMIAAARERLPGVETLQVPELAGEGWRYANHRGQPALQHRLDLHPCHRPPPAPAWLSNPAPEEAGARAPRSPSRWLEDEVPSAPSPLDADGSARFQRGRIVHRLLQCLPERPASEQNSAMRSYLAQSALGLTPALQAEIAAEVDALLALPDLAILFGPGSRPEVPLAGNVRGVPIAGQVDRLAITAEVVLVVDYKTNRAPASPADVPAIYLRQMATYQVLLREIWPDRAVRCALVWTDGPRFMPLDDAELAKHLPGSDG